MARFTITKFTKREKNNLNPFSKMVFIQKP